MVEANYAIWGGALAVSIFLFSGALIARLAARYRHRAQTIEFDPEMLDASLREHTTHHEALMRLMNQKTDRLLASLVLSIERERQKLDEVVRNPSMVESTRPFKLEPEPVPERTQTVYERILPLVGDGMDASGIARRLNLSEAEVALVMQTKAA